VQPAPQHTRSEIEVATVTIPNKNENSMRKLLILTAVVFAFVSGATIAVVGTAIHTQNTSAEANW
jgi:hypothetical protein